MRRSQRKANHFGAIEALESRLMLTVNTVSGTVYTDLNGDGIRETGESIIAGRTVYIDLNSDGVLDDGDASTVSDSNGFYQLSNIPTSGGPLVEVLPEGWKLSNAYGSGNYASFDATHTTLQVDLGSLPVSDHAPLDPTYGIAGKQVIPGLGAGMLVQPDGKFDWVGGNRVFRYLPNGSPDPSFGTNGRATLGVQDNLFTAALESDGKIIVAGENNNGADQAFIERLNADGSPDQSFGVGGRVDSVMGNRKSYPDALLIEATGSIVVSGHSGFPTAGTSNELLARVSSAGVIDPTFAHDGAYGAFTSEQASGGKIVAAPGGGYYIIAEAYSGNGYDGIIGRVTSTGGTDWTWGYGAVPPVAPLWNDLLVQPDGKLLLAGVATGSQTGYGGFVVRLNADGTADESFGTDGWIAVRSPRLPPFTFTSLNAISLQSDGRILAVGSMEADSNMSSALVVRLLPDGEFDHSFTSTGIATFNFSDSSDYLTSITTQLIQTAQGVVDDPLLMGQSGDPGGLGIARLAVPRFQSSIAGTVFADANGNGTQEAGESGLANQTVFIDANGNGVLDGGEVKTTTDANGSFSFGNLAAGTYRIQPVVDSGWHQTAPASGYFSVELGPGNAPPTLHFGLQRSLVPNVGGPYSAAEGGSVMLDASGSTDVGGTIAKYEWDTNYNGTSFVARATGVKVSFSAVGLDGPGSRAIALRVTDASNATAIATGSVTINNAPPKATFTSGGAVQLGSAGSVSFSGASDPSPADVTAGFKYSYDFDNNGSFEIANSTTASATVLANYLATAGAHTIHGRIIDKDGGFTDYTTTIQVNVVTASKGSVAGEVFNDANANGALDTGEKPILGRVVYIDANKNGKLDAGEATTTTASDGSFTFKNLTAGTYRIADVLPAGWRRTAPSVGYFDVTLAAGQTLSGKNFAETQNVLITGSIYNDANGNAKQDTAEKGIASRTVYIDKNKNGKLDVGEPSTVTAADGTYSFKTLTAGSYRVRQVLPAGSRVTNPTAGYYDLTLAAGQSAVGKVFADTTTALISGVVFKDVNSNAKQDAGELGLAGWVVYLDTNNNGKLDVGEKSFTTLAGGKFSFVVPAGTYHLREVLKSGFTRTTPSGGLYTVMLASGQVVTGKVFGDK